MKVLQIPPYSKIFIQIILLLAVTLFTLSPVNTIPVFALPPDNDAWQGAIDITIPYSITLDTKDANIEPDEPDSLNCSGVFLRGGKATVWYKYTPAVNELISLDTLGSTQPVIIPGSNPPKPYEYDTYIAVWTGNPASNPTLVACNDDNDAGFRSQLGFNAVAGTPYYFQVAQYFGLAGTNVDPGYNGGTLKFHVGHGSQVEAYVTGVLKGNYTLLPSVGQRDDYNGINNGPVRVTSGNNVPFLVAERDAWLLNGVVQSFSEMMGLPANQVTTTYYFPWYNNVTMDTQLRFANLGNVSTNITVTIAGQAKQPIQVLPGQSTRVSYPVNNGPVKVQSSGGVPIIVAERDAWLINGVVQSFSEMMGLPGNQLTDTYYFPWYNNVTMDTQLRFANLGVGPTTINVTIAGVPQNPIQLAAGVSTRVSYPGINNGPVKVQSTGGTPIIVAERDAWLINGVVRSFSEMMGLPGNQLTTTYHFPWYNNVTMDTQLRFANLGVAPTNITVTIAGIAQPVIPLAAGVSTRVSYAGINNGPVTVQSSGGVPIIVAERDAWLLNGAVRSFSEMMGLPGNQLATTYYFPWYNNVTMDTQLRFAVP